MHRMASSQTRFIGGKGVASDSSKEHMPSGLGHERANVSIFLRLYCCLCAVIYLCVFHFLLHIKELILKEAIEDLLGVVFILFGHGK